MDAVFSMTQVMAWGTLFELPQAVPSSFTLRHWAFIMHRSFQGGEMYEPYIRCYPVARGHAASLLSIVSVQPYVATRPTDSCAAVLILL